MQHSDVMQTCHASDVIQTCHAMLFTVSGDVQVGLVQTSSLKVRVKVPEDCPCGLASLCVLLKVWLHKDELGAELACDEAWHGCTYAKLSGVVVSGAHHANSADGHRLCFLHRQDILALLCSLYCIIAEREIQSPMNSKLLYRHRHYRYSILCADVQGSCPA